MNKENVIQIANIRATIKTVVVEPLPVIEEIWRCWEDGKDGLLQFNRRAALGLDHYHCAQLTSGDGSEAKMVTFQSAVFDKSIHNGYQQMDELLLVVHKSILNLLWPVTCCST